MKAKDMTADKNMVDDMPEVQAESDSRIAEAKAEKARRHVFFRICAVVGMLCAVSAWLLFYYEPVTAVTAGCAAVVASVCGIFSGRGCLRSLAITGLVASAVLVIVYAAFYWGLAWGVNHL